MSAAGEEKEKEKEKRKEFSATITLTRATCNFKEARAPQAKCHDESFVTRSPNKDRILADLSTDRKDKEAVFVHEACSTRCHQRDPLMAQSTGRRAKIYSQKQ